MSSVLLERPLGPTQTKFIRLLHRKNPEGVWHHRAGWKWSSTVATVRILEGLRVRGLVCLDADLAVKACTPSNQTYRFTATGRALAQTLAQEDHHD